MNMNTVAGFYNLPTRVESTNTAALVLTVPAAAGTYPGLPSPALPALSPISIGLSDLVGSNAYDGHPFKVTVAGIVSNTGTGNFTLTLYQLPLAQVGQIGAAAGVTVAGVAGTGATSLGTIVSGATLNTAAGGSFLTERVFQWDATTGILGQVIANEFWNLGTTTTVVAAAAATCLQVGTSMSAINFMLSFRFATANALNSLKITEFTIQRV
jgi:hypothetical protein